MQLNLIVARARNHVIGAHGGMPWHLPADLAHFKRTTMDCPIIMGRKTWDSIGKPLPGRRSIVVTRDGACAAKIRAAGAEAVASVEAAIDLVRNQAKVFVIGGGEIYRAALPFANRLYVTEIDAKIPGDTRFEFDQADFTLTEQSSSMPDAKNAFALTFQIWDRITSNTGTTA